MEGPERRAARSGTRQAGRGRVQRILGAAAAPWGARCGAQARGARRLAQVVINPADVLGLPQTGKTPSAADATALATALGNPDAAAETTQAQAERAHALAVQAAAQSPPTVISNAMKNFDVTQLFSSNARAPPPAPAMPVPERAATRQAAAAAAPGRTPSTSFNSIPAESLAISRATVTGGASAAASAAQRAAGDAAAGGDAADSGAASGGASDSTASGAQALQAQASAPAQGMARAGLHSAGYAYAAAPASGGGADAARVAGAAAAAAPRVAAPGSAPRAPRAAGASAARGAASGPPAAARGPASGASRAGGSAAPAPADMDASDIFSALGGGIHETPGVAETAPADQARNSARQSSVHVGASRIVLGNAHMLPYAGHVGEPARH